MPARAFCNANPVDTMIVVPVGGNTWCHPCDESTTLINAMGIEAWSQKELAFETWVRISRPGVIKLGIEARAREKTSLNIKVGATGRKLVIKGRDYKTYFAGAFVIKDTGYIKISLKGMERKGNYFADVKAYQLSGTAINNKTAFVKNNEGDFFYWGRRGPSVHLNFPFADSLQAEWLYSEITVPENRDVVGSYFMANGFAEGYFGIQVNSLTERRVLFSVWSPYSTDDPKVIPGDMRIELLKKGEGVNTGEFGNEGSGGQSFLRYNWKAGTTYQFLLHGLPDGNSNTVYTAYFSEAGTDKWVLIASFKRPKTNTYLKKFHSFLENFIPAEGDKTREALYGNQWIRTSSGEWIECTKTVFTYDNTAAKGYRMDYAGGLKANQFYLKNGGFFNEYTNYRSGFSRVARASAPNIEFARLP